MNDGDRFVKALSQVGGKRLSLNEHPSLGKGVGGFYAYTWRGFLDKTDGMRSLDPDFDPTRQQHCRCGRAALLLLQIFSRVAVTRTVLLSEPAAPTPPSAHDPEAVHRHIDIDLRRPQCFNLASF